MRSVYAISLLLFVVTGIVSAQNTANGQSATEQQSTIDDADVYRIYESAVAALASSYKGQLQTAFIPVTQTTMVPLPWLPSDCIKPDTAEEHRLFDTALLNYAEQNKSRWMIKQDGFKTTGIRIVPEMSDVGVTLSAVGFNSDKTAAVLYAFFKCEGNCGKGGWMTFAARGRTLATGSRGQGEVRHSVLIPWAHY